MKNFELVFRTEYDDGYSAGSGWNFTRIVATTDMALAWHIGQGMLGETVGDGLWLSNLTTISETAEMPRIPGLLHNHQIWARVLRQLSFPSSRARFIFSSNIGLEYSSKKGDNISLQIVEPEIVGFIIWPPRN